MARGRGRGGKGNGGSLALIISGILLAFVGVMFIINLGPIIETGIEGYTGTNTFVTAILDMGIWLLPVGGLVALFMGVFRLMRSK